MNGHLPVVQYLVQQGGDVNSKDNDGEYTKHKYLLHTIDRYNFPYFYVQSFDNL